MMPQDRAEGFPISRRALVKAGWVVPVVLAVGIPRDALAQNGSDATVGNGGGDLRDGRNDRNDRNDRDDRNNRNNRSNRGRRGR